MAIEAAALKVVVSADTSKAEGDLKSFSGTMKSMAGGLASAGTMLSAGITTPLVAMGVSAIKTAATFEKSMNVLGYVTEGTSAQMQAMSDQALQLGADTVFSANEAAAGMVELAKAGMNTEEVMDSISGVMALAAAGGIAVEEAATLASATLNTFGLEASKSAEVADILAAAANASAADVRDLAFGVQNAGSVFAASGQSVETLATMMALLANNGLNASDAATSLKTMTMRLTAPTAKAAGVMEDLGIAVFDTHGNMRDYEDIIGDLESATKGLSDEQRSAAFNTIFGADAIRAAIILSNEGAEGYAAMAEAVGEQGAAAAMANAQNSGLAGAMEQIGGSLESLMTKLALPFLEPIAAGMSTLTEFVNQMGELPQPVINAGLAFAAFAASIGLVMVAAAGIMAAVGSPILLVGLAVLGLGAAVAALWAAWELNWGNIQGKTSEALAVIQPYLDTLSTTMGTLATEAAAMGTAIGDALTNLKMPDISAFGSSTLKTNIELQLMATVKNLELDWSELKVNFSGLMTKVGEQLTAAAEQAFGADNIVSRTFQRVGNTLASIQTQFEGISLDDPIASVKSIFAAAFSIYSLFTGIKTDAIVTAVTALESVVTAVLDFGAKLTDSIDAEAMADAAASMVSGLSDAIVTVADADTLGGIGAAAGAFVSSLVTKFGELIGADKFGSDIGTAIGEATVAIASGATAFATSFANEIGATDWGQFGGQLNQFVLGLVTGLLGQIGPALWEASVFNPKKRAEAEEAGPWADIDKNAAADLAALGKSLTTAWEGVGASIATIETNAESDFATLGAAFGTAWATLSAAITTLETNAENDFATLSASFGTAWTTLTTALTTLKTNISTLFTGLGDTITGALTTMVDTVKGAITGIFGGGEPIAAMTNGLNMGSPEVDWGEMPEFAWPALPEFSWPSLPIWEWIPYPTWEWPDPSQLYAWDWPNMSMPGWVGTLISALGGAMSALSGGGGSSAGGGGSGGSSQDRPQDLNTDDFFGMSTSGQVATASGVTMGSAPITINVNVANVNNGMDVEVLAAQLARRFQQKMRA